MSSVAECPLGRRREIRFPYRPAENCDPLAQLLRLRRLKAMEMAPCDLRKSSPTATGDRLDIRALLGWEPDPYGPVGRQSECLPT